MTVVRVSSLVICEKKRHRGRAIWKMFFNLEFHRVYRKIFLIIFNSYMLFIISDPLTSSMPAKRSGRQPKIDEKKYHHHQSFIKISFILSFVAIQWCSRVLPMTLLFQKFFICSVFTQYFAHMNVRSCHLIISINTILIVSLNIDLVVCFDGGF